MSTFTAPPPYVPAILTQTLDEFIKQQVAEQELADEAAYFEQLAEAQRQRKIWDYYEQEVLKAIDSADKGKGTIIKTEEDREKFWDNLRADVEQRRKARQAEKTA